MFVLPSEIHQAEEGGLEELGHDQRALDSDQRHPAKAYTLISPRHISEVHPCLPGKCDGPLLEGVDGDVVGGEVAQVVEELVLHRRRQRPPEVLDVFK